MIEITLFYQEKNLIGIESKGHSGYAESGRDVVCAAVSVLMQSLILGLSAIAQVNGFNCDVDKKIPLIRLTWPKEQSEKISLLTLTAAESLKVIADENPDYVKVHTEEI
ncbi:MAG: ribosomal-processing cysteine protease Prp [Synergistaceae bacterium]|nr:ribosomal-processing cysteine protease Prp [Synergistaceae bacterium]